MLMHAVEKNNSFFSFTFARFFAGFYYYAQKDVAVRM